MSSIDVELAALLSTVRIPGDFYATGVAELPAPGLAVNGVGPVALPLLPIQAEQLIAVAERAPYGRRSETLVDSAVRRTWQISADRVRFESKHWAKTLATIVARAATGLGVVDPVGADFYKLLIYDSGSHFVSHRDTEKAPGMFATLTITLPSVYSGGDLVVRHRGREVRLDVRSEDPSEATFAAFYADCVHEVLPLKSGFRLVLVYNLLRRGSGRAPEPPCYDQEQAGIEALLQGWSAAKSAPVDDTPKKLVYPLAHAYTPAELSFATLKGADAAAAAVLNAAAQRSGFDLHAALLTIEQSGSADHTGCSRSGGWRRYDDDDENEEDFEVGEIEQSEPMLSDWARPDGRATTLGRLPLDEGELCPPDALADMEPDEQHFQEATGNEGASFERTYRRAALVLWPQAHRLAVLNQAGLPATLPYLGDLARRWAAEGQLRDSPLWREAHQLAGHMLKTWNKVLYLLLTDLQREGESDGATMLALMAGLKDSERVEAILADVIAAGAHGKSDNAAVLSALSLFDPQRAGDWVARIVAANAAICLCSCADLLARSARGHVPADRLSAAARALVQALPGDPARTPKLDFSWQKQPVDAGFVVDMVSALCVIDSSLADHAVTHLLAWPQPFDVDAVILPAVFELTEKSGASSPAAVARLRLACLRHLRSRIDQPLEAPRDWVRAAAPGCSCQFCGALSQFLINPGQRDWALKAAESSRQHVEETIRRNRCDVDCATDKRGRPYSLLCRKNQDSYDARAAQRQRDLNDLARLGKSPGDPSG